MNSHADEQFLLVIWLHDSDPRMLQIANGNHEPALDYVGLERSLRLRRLNVTKAKLEELDVEGIPAFAERVLPRTADLWVQASLDQRQRLQQLFFPQGVAFDGNGFVGAAVTAPAFSYLQPVGEGKGAASLGRLARIGVHHSACHVAIGRHTRTVGFARRRVICVSGRGRLLRRPG